LKSTRQLPQNRSLNAVLSVRKTATTRGKGTILSELDRLPGDPARPDDIASSPNAPARLAAAASISLDPRGTERRPVYAPALLPVARNNR